MFGQCFKEAERIVNARRVNDTFDQSCIEVEQEHVNNFLEVLHTQTFEQHTNKFKNINVK